MKLLLNTVPNVHKRVLDFCTGPRQIMAYTTVKVGTEHKLSRCQRREKKPEIIITEKEKLEEAVRAARNKGSQSLEKRQMKCGELELKLKGKMGQHQQHDALENFQLTKNIYLCLMQRNCIIVQIKSIIVSTNSLIFLKQTSYIIQITVYYYSPFLH